MWCELPAPQATAVAVAADRRRVIVTPGPVFASEGGLDRYLRIPFTRPPADLRTAVTVLAEAWTEVADRPVASPSRSRVMVA